MVRRVVPSMFWSDQNVIEKLSMKARYFLLYLMTNERTSQLGIYRLPLRYMQLETDLDKECIGELLSQLESLEIIAYSNRTGEIALLQSLSYSVFKGGKPVLDLLNKELTLIKDEYLIKNVYDMMQNYWKLSTRPFDQKIKELFEQEFFRRECEWFLTIRGDNENVNVKENDKEKEIENEIMNVNDNEMSESNHLEEEFILNDFYIELENRLGTFNFNKQDILFTYYSAFFGDMTKTDEQRILYWQDYFSDTIILEALKRSKNTSKPAIYASGILKKWKKSKVKSYLDIKEIDRKYFEILDFQEA